MFERKDQVRNFIQIYEFSSPKYSIHVRGRVNKISFLDVSITRMNNKLVTSLYRKKTFSGVYMNYNSFLRLKYKKGLIHTLLFRAFNMCADYNTFHDEVQYLKLVILFHLFSLIVISNDF